MIILGVIIIILAMTNPSYNDFKEYASDQNYKIMSAHNIRYIPKDVSDKFLVTHKVAYCFVFSIYEYNGNRCIGIFNNFFEIKTQHSS